MITILKMIFVFIIKNLKYEFNNLIIHFKENLLFIYYPFRLKNLFINFHMFYLMIKFVVNVFINLLNFFFILIFLYSYQR